MRGCQATAPIERGEAIDLINVPLPNHPSEQRRIGRPTPFWCGPQLPVLPPDPHNVRYPTLAHPSFRAMTGIKMLIISYSKKTVQAVQKSSLFLLHSRDPFNPSPFLDQKVFHVLINLPIGSTRPDAMVAENRDQYEQT